MIDLFGLGKKQDPQEPEHGPETASAPEPGTEASAPRGSHKLWAFLLVLDSLFVIVFAGAVAAKVYQHWKAPEIARAPAPRRRPAPKPAPAEPAPAPEPAKAPEPPKPAPAAAEPKPAADAPRPPKPSMLAEAPKRRETPKLADAGGKSAAAAPAAPGEKVKATRVDFKIHAPKAKDVELVGAFIVRGGRKSMARLDDGTWTITLYLNPGTTYRYFFSVDKKKKLDPENPRADKGASLLAIP
ncbi:MAG: hypothetical protein COV48_09050 [Elusimicrobia bacterium CG11_big_fil_rev_8_21_14_0_20_64_6]|nr:MAG: hypothetical protein COV48_09050 [Elusimicrobia bacterium CG11_big_fil_rev_8_21_14_0_20_64_6]